MRLLERVRYRERNEATSLTAEVCPECRNARPSARPTGRAQNELVHKSLFNFFLLFSAGVCKVERRGPFVFRTRARPCQAQAERYGGRYTKGIEEILPAPFVNQFRDTSFSAYGGFY